MASFKSPTWKCDVIVVIEILGIIYHVVYSLSVKALLYLCGKNSKLNNNILSTLIITNT